jgi:beta-lactamase regulating signal transducer with metallopeptidase domain
MSMTLLLDAAIKCTLYLALLFLASSALRQKPAAVRHLLWSVGLIGALLLPALSIGLPWRIGVLPSESAVATPTYDTGAKPALMDTEHAPMPIAVEQKSHKAKAAEEVADTGQTGIGDRDAGVFQLPSLPSLPSLPRMIATVWIIGIFVVLGRLFIGTVAMRSISQRGRRLDSPRWRELLKQARRRLGIDTPVRLVESRHVPTPLITGVLNPVIVLPLAADDWNDDRRLTVLLHELAHYRRGDAFSHLVSQFACAVYWFNPLVWIAARRLRAESERACDDMVLQSGTRASDYVNHLIDIVRVAGPSWAFSVAQPMARRSEFEGRLLAILEPSIKRHGLTPMTTISVVLSVVLSALPLAAMGPEQPESADTKPVASVEQEDPSHTFRVNDCSG